MPNEQIVTELVIDASSAKAGMTEYSSASDQGVAASNRLAAAEAKVQDTMNRQAAIFNGATMSSTRLEQGFARLAASVDPVLRSTQVLQKQYGTLDAAVSRGVTTEERATNLRVSLLEKQTAALDEVQAAQVRLALGMREEEVVATGLNAAFQRLTAALGINAAAFREEGEAAEFAARGMESAAEIAKGLLVGVGAGLAFTGLAELPEKIKSSVEDFVAIANNSKAAGLDPELFQAIVDKAQQAGLGLDTVSTSLDAFNKNSGLAEAGAGRLLTQLRKLDPELAVQIQTDTTQAQRLNDLSNALANETDRSKAAAIAAAAFGPAGLKMIDVVGDGARSIQVLVSSARDMGEIVPTDLIDRADELGKKFDTTSQILKVQFESVLIELGPLLVNTATVLDKVAIGVGTIVDQFQSIDQRVQINPLQNELAATEGTITDLKAHITGTQQWVDQQPDWNPLKLVSENEINASKQLLDQSYAMASQYQDRIDQLQGMGKQPAPLPPDVAVGDRAQELKTYTTDHSGQFRSAHRADPYGTAMQSAKADTAALVAQQQALGQTAFQADKLEEQTKLLNDATSKGVALSPSQLTAIDAASTKYAEQKSVLAALTEVYNTGKQATGDFLSTLKSDLMSSTGLWSSFGDAASKALDDIANKALDMASQGIWNLIFNSFTGISSGGSSSSGGGILGSLLGMFGIGAHASGGLISGPGTGTSDSILARLSSGEFVVNAASTRAYLPQLQAMNSMPGFARSGPVLPMPANANFSNDNSVSVQIIDQRSSGAPVQVQQSVDPNGQRVIRAIIRDEVIQGRRRGVAGF